MKKKLTGLLAALVLCALMLPMLAAAEGTEVKFTSKKLDGFVREALRIGASEPIYAEQLAAVKQMTLHGEGMITGYRANIWNNSRKKPLAKVKLDDLKYFTGLTSLRLELGEYQMADLQVLSEMTGLKELFLQVDTLKNLDMLAPLTGLTDLGVSADGVKTIAPLENMAQLDTLFLNCRDLEDISALEKLDWVKHLTISEAPNVTSIAPVTGMEHITQLELKKFGIRSLEPLRTMQRKFSLRTENVYVQDWSPAFGFGSSKLVEMKKEKIEFADARFEQQLRKAIGREDKEPVYNTELATITALTITSGKVEIGYNYYETDKVRTSDKYGKAMVLDDLAHFPQLTQLMLDIPYNTSESLTAVGLLTDLETLTIRGNKLTTLEALAPLHYLASIEIMGKGITDITPVEGMTVLDHFSMYHTSVESIEPLRNLKYIGSGTVRIGNCKKITDFSPIDRVGDKVIE